MIQIRTLLPNAFLVFIIPMGSVFQSKMIQLGRIGVGFPEVAKGSFKLTKVLDVLEPLRKEITIYSGLSHPAARTSSRSFQCRPISDRRRHRRAWSLQKLDLNRPGLCRTNRTIHTSFLVGNVDQRRGGRPKRSPDPILQSERTAHPCLKSPQADF